MIVLVGWRVIFNTLEDFVCTDTCSSPLSRFRFARAWKIKVVHDDDEQRAQFKSERKQKMRAEAYKFYLEHGMEHKIKTKVKCTSASGWEVEGMPLCGPTDVTHGSIVGSPPLDFRGRSLFIEPPPVPDFIFNSGQPAYTAFRVDPDRLRWLYKGVCQLAKHKEHMRIFENPSEVHKVGSSCKRKTNAPPGYIELTCGTHRSYTSV